MKKLEDLLDAQLIELPAALADAPVEDTGRAVLVGPQLCLDRGYDYAACRAAAAARGYTAHIPPKRSEERPLPPPGDPERHPPRRWIVEVGHSWFNPFRRLLIRWEKEAANYLGFVQLAGSLIIYRKLRHARSLSG